jgi:uncharacterized protein YdaU (DUF1376 family)
VGKQSQANMHYYQFNIGDYASHANHLTEIEDLGFRRLLDLYYLTESPLPGDIKSVCRLVRMREFEHEISQVLAEFFVFEDGVWVNKRADEEIKAFRAKAQVARANGRKGGRPKTQSKPKANPEETQRVNLANPEETQSKAKQEPRTINQEPIETHTPYQAIVSAYEERLPMLPRIKVLTDSRKRHMKARWAKAVKQGKGMDYFEGFFDYVAQSEFLTTGSFCNLEWLMKEANFVKVIEGNYHGKA